MEDYPDFHYRETVPSHSSEELEQKWYLAALYEYRQYHRLLSDEEREAWKKNVSQLRTTESTKEAQRHALGRRGAPRTWAAHRMLFIMFPENYPGSETWHSFQTAFPNANLNIPYPNECGKRAAGVYKWFARDSTPPSSARNEKSQKKTDVSILVPFTTAIKRKMPDDFEEQGEKDERDSRNPAETLATTNATMDAPLARVSLLEDKCSHLKGNEDEISEEQNALWEKVHRAIGRLEAELFDLRNS